MVSEKLTFRLQAASPANAADVKSLYEAVWFYVVLVASITVFSLMTGFIFSAFAETETAIFLMRLLNGVITALLGMRIIRAKQLPPLHHAALAVAALFSASGYEIVGLMLVAWLSTKKPLLS